METNLCPLGGPLFTGEIRIKSYLVYKEAKHYRKQFTFLNDY